MKNIYFVLMYTLGVYINSVPLMPSNYIQYPVNLIFCLLLLQEDLSLAFVLRFYVKIVALWLEGKALSVINKMFREV